MSSGYGKWPVVPAIKPFKKYGQSGIEMSEMLPNVGAMADEICLVRSMNTEAVNHAPGRDLLHDGCPGSRPAQHGSLAGLRPGQRDRQPADIRRDDLERQGQDLRPALLRLLLGQRVPAQPVPGRPVSQHGRPGAVSRQPSGREPRGAAGAARRHGRDECGPSERLWRSRDRHAHRAVRDGLPDANERARPGRLLRANRRTRSGGMAPTLSSKAPSPTTA